ncbi:protein of unknown function [Brevefilum fermentans]|jgi:hypothetical protein|uniref:Uncharacterized protein n=1 Tax=Candidatus Brevifilum fermentans TaxID=1986204 RepID=A0A1Y6K4Z7_9CHLR|nr:protein of unknown function [Brevefilum fermentans]
MFVNNVVSPSAQGRHFVKTVVLESIETRTRLGSNLKESLPDEKT